MSKRPRTRRRTTTIAAGAVGAAWITILAACSTSSKLVGNGGECFQAVDCEPGLVCAPQKSGKRTCTGDLTGVQTNLPASGEDAAADAALDGPATGDGPVAQDAQAQTDGQAQADNFVPADTSVPPDTSPPTDTGTE